MQKPILHRHKTKKKHFRKKMVFFSPSNRQRPAASRPPTTAKTSNRHEKNKKNPKLFSRFFFDFIIIILQEPARGAGSYRVPMLKNREKNRERKSKILRKKIKGLKNQGHHGFCPYGLFTGRGLKKIRVPKKRDFRDF